MTSLKTLKDIEDGINTDGWTEGHLVSREVLKAEAVKHAKNCQHYGYVAELGWIINFFNLTEEDLKEVVHPEDNNDEEIVRQELIKKYREIIGDICSETSDFTLTNTALANDIYRLEELKNHEEKIGCGKELGRYCINKKDFNCGEYCPICKKVHLCPSCQKKKDNHSQQETCGDTPLRQQSPRVTSEEEKVSNLRSGNTADKEPELHTRKDCIRAGSDIQQSKIFEDELDNIFSEFYRYICLKDNGTGGEESWIYVSEHNSDLDKLKYPVENKND